MGKSADDRRANAGMAWTGLEKVIVHGVNFVQAIILARLLKPEDFGLTAMLGIFLAVGGTLAESGLGTALVVYRGDEKRALTWNLAIAGMIYGLISMASPWVAGWYGVPELRRILPVMALTIVFSAGSLVPVARLTRTERFRTLSLINMAVYSTSAVLGVSLAWMGYGVWSIVAALVAQTFVRTVLAWELSPKDDAEDIPEVGFHALFAYGWKVMFSNLVWNIYSYLHHIVIGKLWSPQLVGLFNRGQRWATLPSDIINDVVGRVALPEFAKGRGAAARYLAVNCLLLWPGLLVLWIFARELVGWVLGAQWLDAVPYLRILVFGAAATPFGNVAMKIIQASGRGEVNLMCDAVKRPLGVLALVIGCGYGMEGLCWSYVAGEVIVAMTNCLFAWRLAPRREIDLVFTWYNAAQPPPGMERCRASDNGELRFSLATVAKRAPWIRRIFVLVNDGTPIPDWLSSWPKVTVVEHREVMPGEVLPLYNTAAIEMWLGHIPGLTENFLYANDDMFFGRDVSPDDFFNRRGRVICRYYREYRISEMHGSCYYDMLRYGRKLLGRTDDSAPHHCMVALTKELTEAFAAAYPEEVKRSGALRYRDGNQLSIDAVLQFALATGHGVFREVRRSWVRKLFTGCRYDSLLAPLGDRRMMEIIRRQRPKMFCINDCETTTETDRRELKAWLKSYPW